MKYIFTNLLGSFVFDEGFKIVEEIRFKTILDYKNKEKTIAKLNIKHKNLPEVPKEKLIDVLAVFKIKSIKLNFLKKICL